ncbi:unnamed protein product [Mytilus edulis]|uniref:Uncharacterized protein n=1 Tax=Mytilus edulis TaxID=6550 RepID=A0A8S3TYZ4_MYTED|nr:unnamed protein product [Mytilus edulis]
MAEKLPPDDLPYYKSQLDEIFEQCRTKLDTLHVNTTDQHDQPYIPSDPLLFSPIGRTHKTESYESRALSQAPESSTIRGDYCLYERSEVDPLRVSSRYVDESNIEVGPSCERKPNIIEDRWLRSKSSIPRVSEGTADYSSSEFRTQPRTLSFPSVDKTSLQLLVTESTLPQFLHKATLVQPIGTLCYLPRCLTELLKKAAKKSDLLCT